MAVAALNSIAKRNLCYSQNKKSEVLRMEPQLTLSSLRARTMYAREDVWLKTADGLRLAGMPE